jgi:hypothetical protein
LSRRAETRKKIAIGLIVLGLVIAFAACNSPASTSNVTTPSSTPTPTASPTPTPSQSQQNQQPVEIISVLGPLQPINPGGPIVEITLKNVAVEPVVSLAATLDLSRSFNFDFDVTSSNPLLPDKSISAKLTLIGEGFSVNIPYPLTMNGILQSGATFAYTKQVQIVEPPNK